MRQTSTLSRPTLLGLVRQSLQVAACPCWAEALPDVISSICVEVLGPVPRRASSGALTRFFPTNFDLTLHATSSARWPSRHDSNVHDEHISGLQSFDHLQAPPLARPPDCSYRRSTQPSGQPGRLRHAMHVWLPITNCGIATCLNRAIDTTGLSPVRLRPYRPLHARACSVLRGLGCLCLI